MMRVSILLLVLAVLLGGCFTSRELSVLQRDIGRTNPDVELRRNFVLNLGPGTLHLLERASGLWENNHDVDFSDYLQDIDRVKIGIYDVRQRREPTNGAGGITLPARQGWAPVVIVRDPADATSIYYREHRNTVRDLLIVNASDDQVVVVRLQGNLGRLLLRALNDRERMLGRIRSGGSDTAFHH